MDMPEEVLSTTLSHCTALYKIAIRAPSPQTEWDDFLAMHQILQKIIELQASFQLSEWSRQKNTANFLQWLADNGVRDVSNLEVCDFGNRRGYGLRVKTGYQLGDTVFELPKSLVFTVAGVKNNAALHRLYSRDSTLSAMSNVQLAITLLQERCDPTSFWLPYLDMLPNSYETPLYYNVEQMQALRGTSAYSDALNFYRSIARQYAYLIRLFHDERIPLRRHFTYDAYRWAVATVSTRQNRIPDETLHSPNQLALIPLLDMCNHAPQAEPCTDFDEKQKLVRILAYRELQAGEELCIFYGSRTNAEFLVHNGFVPSCNCEDGNAEVGHADCPMPVANEHNRYTLQLGVAKADRNFELKRKLLAQLSLASFSSFALGLKRRGDSSYEIDLDASLLCFVRVSSADESQLEKLRELLTDADAHKSQIVNWLRFSVDAFKSEHAEQDAAQDWWKIDQSAWRFLQARCQLLMDALSRQQSGAASANRAIQLLQRSEIHILSLALKECSARLQLIASLSGEENT